MDSNALIFDFYIVSAMVAFLLGNVNLNNCFAWFKILKNLDLFSWDSSTFSLCNIAT